MHWSSVQNPNKHGKLIIPFINRFSSLFLSLFYSILLLQVVVVVVAVSAAKWRRSTHQGIEEKRNFIFEIETSFLLDVYADTKQRSGITRVI